ncbi:phosphatidylserine decarboxylase [Clonorchis sinensis]|uniref:Phosphatidylserine decarboxylase proenzyme, mitochondrial n=1 Tax=Clonorchis sinensis TaxID=79923 RepID=G7YDL3_CLOSI|nr:phosphatidylserine decarboxylase [Clonorchis sinensis]
MDHKSSGSELCKDASESGPLMGITTNTLERRRAKNSKTDGRSRFSALEPLGGDLYDRRPPIATTHVANNNDLSGWHYVNLFRQVTVSAFIYYLLYWLGIIYLLKMVFRNLPLRTTSRLVGRIARIRLPYWMREPVFRAYGWLFKVQLSESEYRDDLTKYDTISAFFLRRLASSARVVDSSACLVSPADGTVLSCGVVKAGHLEQVKGIFYSLSGLLGPNTWGRMTPESRLQHNPVGVELSTKYVPCITSQGPGNLPVVSVKSEDQTQTPPNQKQRRGKSSYASSCNLRLEDMMYAEGLLLHQNQHITEGRTKNEASRRVRTKSVDLAVEAKISPVSRDVVAVHEQKTGLYHLLIYLAPGDYHRFHSPTNWSIFMRRHFPGKLYPVSPNFLSHHNGLYCLNERVVYVGRWEHGFFAYIAVGATNVGSIEVNIDPHLVTNVPSKTCTKRKFYSQLPELQKQSKTLESTSYTDLYFDRLIPQSTGEHFGQFNFGSTVILIFEAPVDLFRFTVKSDCRIQVGQSVGEIRKDTS